jgi:hypothetical protein
MDRNLEQVVDILFDLDAIFRLSNSQKELFHWAKRQNSYVPGNFVLKCLIKNMNFLL